MPSFCLTKDTIDKFKKGLASHEINPLKLAELSSSERRSFLAKYVGDTYAKEVNALFESKMLLKNQKEGYTKWALQTLGKLPEIKRDFLAKVEALKEPLNAVDEKSFLQDYVSQRLGISINQTEAKTISDLAMKVQDAKKNITDKKSRIEYGNALLDLHEYTDSLSKVSMSLKDNIINTLNVPRSVMSSLDFSAPFRQGFGMIANPKEFTSAFIDMFKYAASEKAYKESLADIVSRPTYELMQSGGLRITKLSSKLSQREEAFISSLVDKVPLISNSERAYTGFLNKLRADVFDKMVQTAEFNGESISKKSQTIKDIASVVNDFTGSGNLGKNDRYKGAVPLLNSIFFSPRKIAATVNILNPNTYFKLTPTARGYAIRNLVGMVSVSALILSFAKMNGAEVEKDPKSSDFGKFVLGKTHIDVTGGNASYVTLLARLISGQTKNSLTDITKDLQSGVGKATKGDVFIKFVRNKLSPTASFIADWLYGADSVGNPFSVKDEIQSRIMPLVIQDVIESATNDPTHTVLGAVLNLFGFGTQTYSDSTNWTQKETEQLSKFRKEVGDKNFKKANEEYNRQLAEWTSKIRTLPSYKSLSDKEKQSLFNKGRNGIKMNVFSKYNYTPSKQERTSHSDVVDSLLP